MSDAFKAVRNEIERKNFAHVQVELGPLVTGEATLDDLRVGVEEAFTKLRAGVQQHGAIYDHLWSTDGLSVTVNIGAPGTIIREMYTSPDWGFVTWIDVVPRFRTVVERVSDFDIGEKEIHEPDQDSPIICVIDSGVLEGNALIAPACRDGLSKSFHSGCPHDPSDELNHGTGVAGIALYRDIDGLLEQVDLEPGAWLANARILDGNEELGEGQLLGNVLESAIRHFHDLGCRIFNISVNDINRPFSTRTSMDVAEKLDTLIAELDILVVVSSGNLTLSDVQHARQNGGQYPKHLLDAAWRILDPAQAVNALTVGSIAGSHLCVDANRRPLLAKKDQPSPFTRSGPGVNDYIKPELVDVGGNFVVDPGLARVVEDAGCNIVTTRNDIGQLLHRVNGTSFAAPRVAHLAARVLHAFSDLETGEDMEFVPSANLLRALLVNSASVHNAAKDLFANENRRMKKQWVQLCGYGQPDLHRAITVAPTRAVMVYQGEVEVDKVVYFAIPVPVELRQTGRAAKRLRVTVAYDAPVRRTRTYQYCGIRMYWKIFRGNTPQDEIIAAMSVDDDTSTSHDQEVPSEIPNAVFGPQIRNRSTVQHDEYEWKIHKEVYSSHPYTLAVVARRDWDTATQRQRFAVAVSLECESDEIDVANLVSNHLRARIPVRVRR